jgi:N-acetylmuramoyl-L-alanine amidase
MKIYSRRRWGAKHGRGNTTVYSHDTPVYIHHSATPGGGINSFAEQKATMLQFEHHHVVDNGWDAIAYTFVIFPAFKRRFWHRARVFEGRGLGHVPAAQANANSGTVAICVVGNFDQEAVDDSTLDTIARLVKRCPGDRLRGHRDAPGAQTACPGRHLYEKLPGLRTRTGRRH